MALVWFLAALDRAGVSQADLARHLRLAPSAVSRMLKGERQMKLLEAVQVANFLGVSQEDVLRHAGATADPPSRSEAPRTDPPRRGRPPRSIPPRSMSMGSLPPRRVLPGGPRPGRGDMIPIRSAPRGHGEQEMFVG